MDQDVIYKVVRKLKQKPNLMRKVKIALAVGVVGFFVTGALVVWAGLSVFGSAFTYVAVKKNEVMQSPTTQAQIENLKSEAKQLPKFQPINCWGKAQSLLAVQPWLERPALENLMNLKVACLEQIPAKCEGADCQNLEKISKPTDWETN